MPIRRSIRLAFLQTSPNARPNMLASTVVSTSFDIWELPTAWIVCTGLLSTVQMGIL